MMASKNSDPRSKDILQNEMKIKHLLNSEEKSCIKKYQTSLVETCKKGENGSSIYKNIGLLILKKILVNNSTLMDDSKTDSQTISYNLSNFIRLYLIQTMNLCRSIIKDKKKQNIVSVNVKKISFSMKILLFLISLVFILQLLPLVSASKPLGDPYNILGLPKFSSLSEIRKAYIKLVKEWHPDKNKSPEAEAKFITISKAYQLLSDPERKKDYDKFGITEEGLSRHRRNSIPDHESNPFEDFFGQDFRYQSRDISLFHKMTITHRAYENTILPKSYRTAYIILFYTDWCFSCLKVEPVWRKLINELEPIGVNLVTVQTSKEPALAKKLNVRSLPSLVVLVGGLPNLYKEPITSASKIVDYLRTRLPYRLFSYINNDNLDNFLSGWMDNKIRALIFEKREKPRLRYLLTAWHHKDHVVFGFVQTGVPQTKAITERYKISEELDTLLLFNENLDKPMAAVSMNDIPIDVIHNMIGNNKFLILPRLSNQAVLDSVCPQEWQRPQKRLCAVLISQNSPEHEFARHKFRQAASSTPYSQEKVRYTYVFKDTQPQFISALLAGEGSPMDPLHHIVIIWRRDSSHIKYQWFSPGWINETTISDVQWNETRLNLEQTIHKILKSSESLPFAAEVQELTDEHALNTMDRITDKILRVTEHFVENLTKEQVLIVSSVLITIVLILVIAFGMNYLVKLEEASVQAKYGRFNENSKSVTPQPELKLHNMRVETYNGLVRLLKPGCRTIVLLVDSQTKLKLIPAFHKAVWPYRKNKTLMFCHLSLERGLQWFKKILTLSLQEPKDLHINPKNCVGTVLALNGHRKYFCVYHAKHPESRKGNSSKRMEKITKRLAQFTDAEAGAFIGFDSSSDSEVSQDEKNEILYQDNLLDGLPMWLDRLFEGSTQRYYINYWPEFTTK